MEKTDIPHALGESIVRGFPDSVLNVTTMLAEKFGEPGFDAAAKKELLRAVAARVARDDLQGYQIHWEHNEKLRQV